MRRSIGVVGLLVVACVAQAQDATQPPAGQHALLTVQGRGVQIYSCSAGAGSNSGQWVFVAPAARLFDKDGVEVGTHGDGPVWHLEDGSSVVGQVVAKAPSPDAGSVPWLLLKVASKSGAGALAAADFVRRSETKGGAAPAGGCEVGALLRVPYQAMYTFYSSK
jgi:hypothetical protein